MRAITTGGRSAAAERATRKVAAARQAEQRRMTRSRLRRGGGCGRRSGRQKRGDRLAMTRLRYADAAQHYAAAAKQRSSGPSGRAWHYLEWEAWALYQQGENGIMDLRHWLLIVTGSWPRATARATMPLDWARTQVNLGNARDAWRSRAGDSTRLEGR